jgi:hypothetical protein
VATTIETLPLGTRTLAYIVAHSYDFLRLLVSLALLFAAGLKASQLSSEYLPLSSLWESRFFLTILVLTEIGVGIWLIFGIYAKWSRIAALALFLEFFIYSLLQGLIGQQSCGCLGKMDISPWLMCMFDAVVVAALLSLRPTLYENPLTNSGSGRLLVFVIVYLLIAIPAATNMILYYPRAPLLPLRRDRQLRPEVAVDVSNPTSEEMLKLIGDAAQLSFTIDPQLVHLPPDYGRIGPTKLTVWQLMEGIVEHQRLPARWDKTEQGYHLRNVAPLGTRGSPWLASAAIGAALVFGARVWTTRKKNTH